MHFTHPKHVVPFGLLALVMIIGLGSVAIQRQFRPSIVILPEPTIEAPTQQTLEKDTVYLVKKDGGEWLVLNEDVYEPGKTGEKFQTKLGTHDFANALIEPLMKLPDGRAEILGAVSSPVDERVTFSLVLEPMISFINPDNSVAGYSPIENILFEYSQRGMNILLVKRQMGDYNFVTPVAYSPDAEHLAAFLYSCYWCDAWTHGAAVIPTPSKEPEFVPGLVPAKPQVLKNVSTIEWADSEHYRYKNFVVLPDENCPEMEMEGPCLENSENVPWTIAEVPKAQPYSGN